MTDNIPTIPVTREILQSYVEPPAATSSLYSHRSVRTRKDGIQEHVIVGVHVIFQPGHSNGLYDAFNVPRSQTLNAENPSVATRAILIACDTLEIYGELSLPECEVAIYARKLIFKNQGNINTTPLAWAMQRAADCNPATRKGGANGAEGRHVGSISVFISEFDVPTHESMKRFVCLGGRGQDAGHGANGADGNSMSTISNQFKRKDTWRLNIYNASFTNPCVYATYHWQWAKITTEKGKRGVDDWPTNGQDALEPGIPGSGGNGGTWVSNHKRLESEMDNRSGEPGRTAPNVRGGSAGNPTTATHYDVTIYFNLAKENPDGDNNLLKTQTTSAGKSYTAQDSKNGRGKSPAPSTIEIANAWVHPLQLEAVLRYARDAFLAGARDDVSKLLKPYESALAAPIPTAMGKSAVWTEEERARWNSAQSEVATILHRLRLQLDYFGNPAGYMPLLSLQATMRLYDLETDYALRMLLLAAWVQDKANEAQSAANAFGSAIEDTIKDTERVAGQLVQAEAEVAQLNQQLTSLESRLNTKAKELETLRTKLFNQAAHSETQKALIRGGIKMAAAICQVVPIGQPVLGTVGKLANIAADVREEGVPDTMSKMGDTIKKAREAAKKAEAAKKKAKEKAKGKDEKEAKEEASVWGKAGDGLGSALSMAGGAIGALQVSEEEIEVELAKLTASSPEWDKMVEEIRTLNKDKSKLFTRLSIVLQALGDGYARLASNADAVVTMQKERNQTLGKLSPEANQVVAKMGQAARLSLQRTLYLMVKAYETTVFKPIDVNWNLDAVFDEITKLLKPKQGFDAATINSYVKAVATIFDANKRKIKESLLKDYGFGDTPNSPLEFGFTTEETPDKLEQLRLGYDLRINPLVYGLIIPTQERAKAASFECTKLVFNASGPQLPKSGNAKILIRLDGDGTIRSGEHLYAVRSDAPRVWSWTYHFSDKSVEANVPSLSSLDLLNMILQSDDQSIKQKLAAPPAWSELTINLEFSPPIAPEKRPALESLIFVCKVDSLQSPDAQRVLDVRAEGASAHIEISPADLAGRGEGYGDSYRIYSKADKVKLEAPAQIGGRPFSHWDILASRSYNKEEKSQIELVLNTDTLAYSRYQPLISSSSAIMKLLAESDPKTIEIQLDDAEQAAAAALIARAKHAPLLDGEAAGDALLIRAGADANQPIIGLVEEGDKPTVLEENAGVGDWMKVGYKGLVGYIAKSK
ncbi:MAG TPA: SH3 domain-containing protein [Pyrinomonadaceae bacterium]|jgi:hypothetical protein